MIWMRVVAPRLHLCWLPFATPLRKLLATFVILVLVVSTAGAQTVSDTHAIRLARCRSGALEVIKPDKTDVSLLKQISDYCYAQIRGEDVLEDFDIRRSKLVQQEAEGTILLWMVVALTLSGVAMAALQLFGAYRLAETGRAKFATTSELSLEQSKISLRSSVTGLLILVVSFAFFIVYIGWVFTIKESRIDVETGASAPARAITLGVGGLGSPPKN
jgi:hypothetical protein